MARRSVLKMIAAAAAAPAILPACGTLPQSSKMPPAPAAAPKTGPAGTLTDPDLVHPVVPWPLVLDDEQLNTLAVLSDLIIPADEQSPAAGSLGAHRFVDEWISAPYEDMQADQKLVLEGLVWLDGTSQQRYEGAFRDLTPEQQTAICDDICYLPKAKPEHQQAAHFFSKLRDLVAMAFYTTPAGMKDVGYVGNVPLSSWPPPPPEALRHVGLEPD